MSLFSTKPKIGGIIAYLNLQGFWNGLTDAEQDALTRYNRARVSTSPASSPIEGTITWTSQTQLGYFSGFIGWATADGNYQLAEKMIRYGEQYRTPIIDLHFFYTSAIKCYYKQREINESAIRKTIEYCEKDIALFPKCRAPMVKEFGTIPQIPSFQQLAIIYEKMGEYVNAINICKLAIKYGLQDGTKGGFEGRLAKLEKKLT